MAASYPASIVTFTTQVDFESVDSAENINALQSEVQAVEAILGALAGTTTASSTGPGNGTVLAQITYLNTNKSSINHTHTQLPPVALGGATTGPYIEASGDSLNAYNGAAAATMTLQTDGGDLAIGTAASNTQLAGTLTVQKATTLAAVTGTKVTCQTLDANGTGSFNNVTTTKATVQDTLTVNGEVNLNTQGASVTFYNNETIQDLNINTVYDIPGLQTVTQYGNVPNSTLHSRFAIQGQLWAHKNRTDSTNDWRQGSVIVGRTNEEQSTLSFAGLNEAGVGSAWCIQMNNDANNLGMQHHNGDGTYCAVSASSFVTASSARFKDDVQELATGLDVLAALRPVSFTQNDTGHHVNGRNLTAEENAKAERRRDIKLSAGEKRRRQHRRHGLIAEEVAKVLPEVVGYDEHGRPEGIDYPAMTGVLINAIKQLQARVATLEGLVGTP